MKNLKSFLLNCGTILLGALTLIFLSQGYIKYTLGALSDYVNGYDIIDFSSTEGRADMSALSILIVTILVSVLVLIALINILGDCGAFKKSKSFDKFMSAIEVILALVTFVFTVVGFGCLCSLINDMPLASVGWALVTNLIISLLICAISFFKLIARKKK